MAGIISMSLLATVVSLSLMTPGSLTAQQLSGQDPVSIAQIQSDLDVLGMNGGPVNGRLSRETYQSAENFVTQFGQSPGVSLAVHLQEIVGSLPDLGPDVSGASVVAVQSWLQAWHLYSGPVNGHMNLRTKKAVRQFQRLDALPVNGLLNGPTLESMAHLSVVRQAYLRHWTYRAEAHDLMSEISWATGIPLKTLEEANPQHGTVLWVGQVVHFQVPKRDKAASQPSPASVPPVGVGKKERQSPPLSGAPEPVTHSAKAKAPNKAKQKGTPAAITPPSGSAPAQGVYSNLQPIAALVLYNPDGKGIAALLDAQKIYPHDLIDVAVTGEWVVDHPAEMAELEHSGNEVIMDGYTGVSLNSLPSWGVRQEVQWSVRAFQEAGLPSSAFISQAVPFNAASSAALGALNVLPMSPVLTVTRVQWAQSLESGLLSHSEGVLGSSFVPQSPALWTQLFGALAPHHFVFLTLGQIWANGG